MGALYQISFPNGKSYIGITKKTAIERFNTHRYQAKGRRPHAIYNALREHGRENATLTTLAIADYDYLQMIEPKAIAAFGTKAPNGYNMTDGGEGTANPTAETRAKIGAAHKGKAFHTMPHSAETRAMMSINRKGKKKNLSPEQREKKAALMRGNTFGVGRKQGVIEKERRAISQMGVFKGATSGYVGVSFHKESKKWRAHITVRRQFIDLGSYKKIEDAIAARAKGEVEFAR